MEKVEPVSTGAPSLRVDQVLETATRLFTERGYDAASIRDLAAALAMRPSSLYHHFQGKQHILFAICFGMQTDFNAAVMPLFHQGKGPVEFYVAVVKPGAVLFELAGVPLTIAKEAFRLADAKLPFHCRFIAREGAEV